MECEDAYLAKETTGRDDYEEKLLQEIIRMIGTDDGEITQDISYTEERLSISKFKYQIFFREDLVGELIATIHKDCSFTIDKAAST